MPKYQAFLRMVLAASLVLATASVGAAAGMGGMGGGSMGGGSTAMSGGMTMGGYSSSGAMMGQSGSYTADPQDDRPGMGNIAISGRHIVQLSPARQTLPKIDRNLVGTLVPVPEMPDK